MKWIQGAAGLLFGLGAWCATAHAAHPGPSLWGDFTLLADRVVLVIEGAAGPLTTNLELDRLLLGPMSDDEKDRLGAAIEDYFRSHNPVTVDGERVMPRLARLVVQDGSPDEQSWKSARIELVYPCAGLPRHLGVRWDRFEGEGIVFVPFTIRRTRRGPPQAFSLWPDHPGWTWHADDVRPRLPPPRAVTVAEPTRVPVPTLSAVLILLGVVLAGGLRRRAPAAAAAALLVSLSAAYAARGRLVWRPRLPFARAVSVPAPPQARAIFESLHRGVYEAFRAESEDAIYDALARVVDASLLDDLYAEVFESLVLREQGGAVCSVDEVEVLDGEVDPSSYERDRTDGPPEFVVDWKWIVRGSVAHWGHVHRRTNRYRARYTVRHDGASWKIAAVEVLEHEKVDDGPGG